MSPLAHLLRGLVLGYRYTLSAFLGRHCRFAPSCSEYAFEAIGTHGAIRGSWLALKRIARCRPGGGSGWDPVPPRTCRHNPGRDPQACGSDPARTRP